MRGAPAQLPGALLPARRPLRSGRARAERRALWWYRLRGWRILGANVWAGGNELDLIARRGRELRFVEVKEKSGAGFGDPLEMVTAEKQRRVRARCCGVAGGAVASTCRGAAASSVRTLVAFAQARARIASVELDAFESRRRCDRVACSADLECRQVRQTDGASEHRRA